MSQENTSATLSAQLAAYKEKFLQKADQRKIDVYEEGIQDVVNKGLVASAVQAGDAFVDFTLNSCSTDFLISAFVASTATLNTYWLLASATIAAFSEMCGPTSTWKILSWFMPTSPQTSSPHPR